MGLSVQGHLIFNNCETDRDRNGKKKLDFCSRVLIENLNHNSGYSCRNGEQVIDLDFYFHELIQTRHLFLANDRKIAFFWFLFVCIYVYQIPVRKERNE